MIALPAEESRPPLEASLAAYAKLSESVVATSYLLNVQGLQPSIEVRMALSS
jgi:hypothetical protein